MIYCGITDNNRYRYHYILKNYVIGGNPMVSSNSYRKRKLDIICEIDFSKKRICIYPSMSKKTKRKIEMLAYELDVLELKHQRQIRHIY